MTPPKPPPRTHTPRWFWFGLLALFVVVPVLYKLLRALADPAVVKTLFMVMFGLMIGAVAGAVYFLPTIAAYNREKVNTQAIFVLNLFLGWTLLGWVIALVWAVTEEEKDKGVAAWRSASSPPPSEGGSS